VVFNISYNANYSCFNHVSQVAVEMVVGGDAEAPYLVIHFLKDPFETRHHLPGDAAVKSSE